MAIGVIGLGNIGRGIATNLVADGNDVVVYDVDAAAMEAIAGARRRPTWPRWPSGRRHAALPAHPRRGGGRGDGLGGRRRAGRRAGRPVHEQPGRRAPAGGEAGRLRPPSGGGAVDRRGHRRREADAGVHGRRRRRARRPGPARARAARARHLPRRTTGPRQHHEAAQQPHRLHHHLGEPGGAGHGHQGGHCAARKRWRSCAPRGASNFFIDRQVETIDGRNRPTQFALELAAKDAGLIVETGDAVGAPTPVGAAIKGVLDAVVAEGLGGADWSELVTFAERQADVALRWNAG